MDFVSLTSRLESIKEEEEVADTDRYRLVHDSVPVMTTQNLSVPVRIRQYLQGYLAHRKQCTP